MQKIDFIYTPKGLRTLRKKVTLNSIEILFGAVLCLFQFELYTLSVTRGNSSQTMYIVSIATFVYALVFMLVLFVSVLKNQKLIARIKKASYYNAKILNHSYISENKFGKFFITFSEILKFVLVLALTFLSANVFIGFFYDMEFYIENYMTYYALTMLIGISVINLVNFVINSRKLGIEKNF